MQKTHQNDTERLTIDDKSRLKDDIRLSLIIGLILLVSLVILVGLIPLTLLLLGKSPSQGFLIRALYILGLLFLAFLAVSWKNLLKYIDIQKGKKVRLEFIDYEITDEKGDVSIITKDSNKSKIGIDEKLLKFINPAQPLTIELSPITNSLLFISHDSYNWLDKLDNDVN